ncbi:dTDP-4-dehydrorhamnose reductase [Sphingomonas sp. DT-51]|uniref:dTDP-4-dehydrorhamnose reductase n=1 Tax=Sphingomonas sp. DT-51 TaxID=3396165 RepID=UPI003F1A5062
MREVLVTGANGQVATALVRAAWPAGWCAVALDRGALDLRSPEAIARCVAERDWSAVINAAAYTAVDAAESDQVTAWQVNALAPAAISAACAAAGIPLLQLSTDYVFPGDRAGAWQVDDRTAPLGVYGASKLGGELAVRSSGARHVIVRTSWVVSPHGRNFVRTMLRLGAERDQVQVVADQRGSPTSAADLAAALVAIVVRLVNDDDEPSRLVHFSNAGATDWATFATEIFRQSAARGGPYAEVVPITSADYPTAVRRPANSLLSHEAIGAAYGIVPRHWQAALGDILDDVIGAAT